MDFSDTNDDANVHLNSIYESRGKFSGQGSNDDQAGYGTLDWSGAQAHRKEDVAPYVVYDPTQDNENDDIAEDRPFSLDPSQ